MKSCLKIVSTSIILLIFSCGQLPYLEGAPRFFSDGNHFVCELETSFLAGKLDGSGHLSGNPAAVFALDNKKLGGPIENHSEGVSRSGSEEHRSICNLIHQDFSAARFSEIYLQAQFNLAQMHNLWSEAKKKQWQAIIPQRTAMLLERKMKQNDKEEIQDLPVSLYCQDSFSILLTKEHARAFSFEVKGPQYCDFVVRDQPYKLANGKNISLSLRGTIEPAAAYELQKISIKTIAWSRP